MNALLSLCFALESGRPASARYDSLLSVAAAFADHNQLNNTFPETGP